MQTQLSRQLYRGQRRVIVIGEPLAREGINEVLDTYTRDPNISLRTDMFVVKGGTAREFLKTSYPLETIPVVGVLKENAQTGVRETTGLLNFLLSANGEGRSPTLPAIGIGSTDSSKTGGDHEDQSNAKGFRIVGTGILDKDLKLIGFLNMDESRGLYWVTGNLQRLMVTAFVPQEKGYVSLDVNRMGSKIQPITSGTK